MKVAIHKDDQYGMIKYDAHNHRVIVNHPDSNVRAMVRKYLNSERAFTVPADNDPNKRGSRMIMYAIPVEDEDYLDMALCEMYHAIGVHVDWSHEDNTGYKANSHLMKDVRKSIDGDEEYDIIN